MVLHSQVLMSHNSNGQSIARQNFKNGNFAAASLDHGRCSVEGALTAIPGPVGWAALAAASDS